MRVNSIIVGSGIAGITLARRLAEEKEEKVLLVEKKQYIGGFCYDYKDKNGIMIHKYGPHIFRTNNEQVYNYLSRFTKWKDYQHKVLTNVEGKFLPMPINLDTINGYLGTFYTSENVQEYFERVCIKNTSVINVKQKVISQIGETFYKAFFENYTEKQWGEKPENLPVEIINRIPIRKNRDDRYFTEKYQGIPASGYTEMFLNMCNNKNIRLMLNTDFKEIKDEVYADKVYYSGSIDEYYNYCFGKLPYRCVTFELEELPVKQFQPVAVVNYPNNYDYTRITEYKHFGDYNCINTIIAKEYPSFDGERSYPIPVKKNLELYQKYFNLKTDEVSFVGRLGQYKYMSMDQIVESIINLKL